MSDDDLLTTYLRDHLAAAIGGTEHAERIRRNSEGEEREVTTQLLEDISQDRRVLEVLMEEMDISRSALKGGAAWLGEKISRLKTSEGTPLGRVLELEGLAMGITGKLALWRTLRRIARIEARLSAFDFDALVERARQQRETVAQLQERAVHRAFTAEWRPE